MSQAPVLHSLDRRPQQPWDPGGIQRDVLDLRGAAAELGLTYDWLQRHWRTEPGFPPPFKGARKGQRPLWARQVIVQYKTGHRWAEGVGSNDPRVLAVAGPARFGRDLEVDALIAAAGG